MIKAKDIRKMIKKQNAISNEEFNTMCEDLERDITKAALTGKKKLYIEDCDPYYDLIVNYKKLEKLGYSIYSEKAWQVKERNYISWDKKESKFSRFVASVINGLSRGIEREPIVALLLCFMISAVAGLILAVCLKMITGGN